MAKGKSKPTKKISKPNNELYYKGKRITNEFKETVKETARITKVDVSTPEKLKDFYTARKSDFALLFETGVDTSPVNISRVFNQFNKAINNKNDFYYDEFGEIISISGANAKYELAKTEHLLNVMFGATGVEFSYKKKLDNTVIIVLPTEDELESLLDEPVEIVNDYLSAFGIKIYVSDESEKKPHITDEQRKQRQKSYSDKVNNRLKQFRKEYLKERKKKTVKRKKK